MLDYLFALLGDDRVRSCIRTAWPMLLGALAGWLVTLPLHLPASVATAAVVWLGGTAVYVGGRWLESRAGTGLWPRTARGLGAFVLSLGLATTPPSYPKR